MTTYNTGNPVPSADARDRYDNSQTLDEVVNGDSASYTTRTGKQVISLGGMNSRFNNAQDARESSFNLSQEEKQEAFQSFLDGSGWSSIGAYGAGVIITSHTQTVDYLGQPYQLKPSIPASLDAPYVTTGVWATEGVNFKLVGDNSLRQDLAGVNGPTFVARSAFFVGSIQEMIGLPQTLDSKAVVASYHASKATGGDLFVFDGSKIRTAHDGMNTFSPTVPFTWADFGASYLNGVGETNPTAAGCWVRQSADTNVFKAGAQSGTDITSSIVRAIATAGACSIPAGSFKFTPGLISTPANKFAIGAGIGRTNLTATADTADWLLRSRGGYSGFSSMSIFAAPAAQLTGAIIQVEIEFDSVTYKPTFKDLYLKGIARTAKGVGIKFVTSSLTGKGITFPIVENVTGVNLRSVLGFTRIGNGFTDSGEFTNIRAIFCAYASEMEPRALGSSTFTKMHGRYDAGYTLGLWVDGGTRNTYWDCIMYDYASAYCFVGPASQGCTIGSTALVSQGSSVQDKGWGTRFIGPPHSVTPESSGGAGYGWLEQHDNCLGFDPTKNWNVTKTGTSAVTYTGSVNLLGPMMRLTASGGAGSVAGIDYATSYACNPFQQTKLSGFFYIPATPANLKFEAGLFDSLGTTSVSLVADASVSPNFYFLIKQAGQADVIQDTGKIVEAKRYAFGITRTGTSGGLTLHFDCLPIATDISFSEATRMLQPRLKLTSVTASATDIYMNGITLRTTSDTYVSDLTGSL